MASKEIREFDAVVTPADNDKLLVQQTADNITRYMTPSQVLGLLGTVSQAEAEAGTATTRRVWTAERVKQAVEALAPVLEIPVLGKTGAYVLTTSDARSLIDATANTWSLTLPAAATAGDGFWFAVRNSGAGVITIDPNAAELIDGAATIALSAGESCFVICTGSAWKTVGRPTLVIRATADVTTTETTTSTSYTDLATAGPAITLTPGRATDQIILFGARLRNNGANGVSAMSIAIAGAGASDADALTQNGAANVYLRASAHILATSVASGSTHTAKYKVDANTGEWANRRVSAFTLS